MKKLVLIIFMLSLFLMVGCKSNEAKYMDGNYTGIGEGKYGPIKVEVIVENGKLQTINIIENQETPGFSEPAFEKIPALIIKNQTTSVDAISGATATSDGVINAVVDALKDAQK